MGIQSVEQLNLKATALSQLQLQQKPEEQLKRPLCCSGFRIKNLLPIRLLLKQTLQEQALLRELLDICAVQRFIQVLTEISKH